MKIALLSLFVFLLAQFTIAQSATDYLCTNTTKSLAFKDFRGKDETHHYVGNFDHKGDKVFMYQRNWITNDNGPKKDTLIMIVHHNSLIVPGYVYKGFISNDDPYADTIPMLKVGETITKRNSVAADMSFDECEVTITRLAEYTLTTGIKFKDVIKYDKFFIDKQIHYIIYIAKGEGLIAQGDSGLYRVN